MLVVSREARMRRRPPPLLHGVPREVVLRARWPLVRRRLQQVVVPNHVAGVAQGGGTRTPPTVPLWSDSERLLGSSTCGRGLASRVVVARVRAAVVTGVERLSLLLREQIDG